MNLVFKTKIAFAMAFIFAVLVIFIHKGSEAFEGKPFLMEGWLEKYNEFQWFKLPAYLIENEQAAPDQYLQTMLFKPDVPKLVAIENVGNTGKRLVISGGKLTISNTLAEGQGEGALATFAGEVWAVIRSGNRYELRSARPGREWAAFDDSAKGSCRIARVQENDSFNDWIIEPSRKQGTTNTFTIRTGVCNDGLRYFLAVRNNVLAMVPQSQQNQNGVSVVWEFKEVMMGTPVKASITPSQTPQRVTVTPSRTPTPTVRVAGNALTTPSQTPGRVSATPTQSPLPAVRLTTAPPTLPLRPR